MAYDVLGRMLTRTEHEYTTTWSYDRYANLSACTKGIGKLCEVTMSHGISRKFVYDSLGRPLNARTTVASGPSFAAAVAYTASTGRIASQTYPTGLKVNYTFTTKGFLEKLTLGTAATVNPLPATPGGTPGSSASLPVNTVLWQAKILNAWGRPELQTTHNGVNARVVFEGPTGRVTALTAGPTTTNTVLNQTYAWDALGNLTARTDAIGDGSGAVSEAFVHDALNRLTQYDVSSAAIVGLTRRVTLQYNALGSLLYRSDIGAYTYPASGSARPHAVVSVNGAALTTYTRDANGNLTGASGGRYTSLAYTSFNLPDASNGVLGDGGATRSTWIYDESHARLRETRTITGGVMAGTRTTWMLHPDAANGLAFEHEINAPTTPSPTNPAVTSNRHYLSAGGQPVGVLVSTGALPTLAANATAPPTLASITLVKVEYWHRDQLGSLAATTDHAGAVTARFAYDPFGQRRFANGVFDLAGTLRSDYSPAVNYGSDRGFTGHEQLDEFGLVHMNGRLYDPRLGVFLQADPLLQDALNLQNYQRYAYCFNGPLGCTDPTGYFFLTKWWKKIWHSTVGRAVLSIAVAVTMQWYVLPTVFEIGATTWQAAAISGFSAGAVQSGDLKGALQGAFFASAFSAVGSAFGPFDFANLDVGKFAGAVATHAVVGCAQSVAAGSKCGPGALSAAFSKLATPVTGPLAVDADGGKNLSGVIVGTVVSAVVGGTAAELGGGKFANGAVTGAFGYLFNQVATSGRDPYERHQIGVKAAIEEKRQLGFEVLSEAEVAVYIQGHETARKYDFLIRDPWENRVIGVEVKTTLFDRIFLDQDQVNKDVDLIRFGGLTAEGVPVRGVSYVAYTFGSTSNYVDLRYFRLLHLLRFYEVPVDRGRLPGLYFPATGR